MIGHVREVVAQNKTLSPHNNSKKKLKVCQKLMDSLHKEAEGGAAFELKKKFGKMR